MSKPSSSDQKMKRTLCRCTLLTIFVFILVSLAGAQTTATAKASPDTKISKAQAEDLFRSVDEIVQFVSKDTGLPIKAKVGRKLADRDQVQKYVEKRMAEDEDRKRLESSELVLKKLGLLPRDFQLRTFLVSLLREQVAAFYDAKTKAVFMLDWLPPEVQKPILAHELTHALQDQDVDLEKWIKDVRTKAKESHDDSNAEALIDEEIGARTALLEGQGMAVLVDYSLAPTGRTLADVPQLVDAIKQGIGADQNMPLLSSAPLMLRESLIFPYRDGLGFVSALLQKGGKKMAYAGALNDPPENTREILSPAAYLKGERLPPMHIPDLEKTIGHAGWKTFDAGSIGQLDIEMFGKQFSTAAYADTLPNDWRGGYYWAASPGADAKGTGDIHLVVVTRWVDEEAARNFEKLYQNSLTKKYARVSQATDSKGDFWNTDEGRVSFRSVHGTSIITEGFGEAERSKIDEAVLAAANDPKSHVIAEGNLSTRVMRPFYAAVLQWHTLPALVLEMAH